jgi:hypothetical protein
MEGAGYFVPLEIVGVAAILEVGAKFLDVLLDFGGYF